MSPNRTGFLGKGVYHLTEVARYTDLNPQRVRSWFRRRADRHGHGPLLSSDFEPIEEDYAVSFLDLIDVLVAGRFRECGVKMHVVRSAFSLLSKQLDTPHPFCHSRLFTDGKRIFLLAADSLGDETLSEVVSRQQFFTDMLLPHLERIDYSEDTCLANRWRIAQGVFVDPSIAFGKPIVANTNITTFVVSNSYVANRNNSVLVADLYAITESDVMNAVAFEAEYGTQRAA